MSDNATLAVAITTKNNIRTIRECLESVLSLADHIFVVDSGSTDGTVELCESLGATVEFREWPGVVDQKQYSIDKCRQYTWVLSLDSDESLDSELAEQVRNAVAVNDPSVYGYSFNRKVWFEGAWLNHVFQPEHRLRLLRPQGARVVGLGPDGKGGHDKFVVDGPTAFLQGTCKHDSWEDPATMMRRYVELGVRAARYDGKPSNSLRLFLSPLSAFIKQYFLKRGFLDGKNGLVACFGVALGTGMKHLFKNSRA